MLKVHFAPKSRALRVVWLLEELGLSYDLINYTLAGPEMRTPEFRAVNPMARVPVLEDGEVIINESGAILEYVLSCHAPGQLRPGSESRDYPAYLQWLHYAEGMMMPQVNSYMVETFFLPPERRSEQHAKRAQKLLGRMLVGVEAVLQNTEYLAGEFSAADIMTGSAVISAQNIGVDMSSFPNCSAYIDRLKQRSAYQKAAAL